MSHNMIIAVGGCGTNIIKAAAKSNLLDDVTMYAIDSVTSSIDIQMVNRVNVIPIISDEKSGSGRNRERGRAMFEYHDQNGKFEKMYEDAVKAKTPVIVITSAAGGTGSGSVVPLCEKLLAKGVEQVIPIIVCPNMQDPDAYHLNTNDCLIELGEVGIKTYSIFRNTRGDADYAPVNNEVVNLIEIIFGKRYDKSDADPITRDTIDDSDLDMILETPGRFIAVSAQANDVDTLQKEVTRKVLSGFQMGWTAEDAENSTLVTAIALTSMFASKDYPDVFAEVGARIKHSIDQYKHIVDSDNGGICTASMIVAGLPRPEVKQVSGEFRESAGLAAGLKRSERPSFMTRKKASVSKPSDNGTLGQFNWK